MTPTDQGIYMDPTVATLLLFGFLLLSLVLVTLVIIAVVNGFSFPCENQRPPREKRRKRSPLKKADVDPEENFEERDGADTAERVASELFAGYDVGRKDQSE